MTKSKHFLEVLWPSTDIRFEVRDDKDPSKFKLEQIREQLLKRTEELMQDASFNKAKPITNQTGSVTTRELSRLINCGLNNLKGFYRKTDPQLAEHRMQAAYQCLQDAVNHACGNAVLSKAETFEPADEIPDTTVRPAVRKYFNAAFSLN